MMKRTLLLTIVIATVFISYSDVWSACLESGRYKDSSFSSVIIKFEAGEVAKNIVTLYRTLWESDLLPCTELVIPTAVWFLNQSVSPSLSTLLVESQVIPSYPAEMDGLLCDMNPTKCKNGKIGTYHAGDNFNVPKLFLKKYQFNYSAEPFQGEKIPDDVIMRTTPEFKEMPDENKAAFIKQVSDENLGFKRDFTVDGRKVIYIPRTGYYLKVKVPINGRTQGEQSHGAEPANIAPRLEDLRRGLSSGKNVKINSMMTSDSIAVRSKIDSFVSDAAAVKTLINYPDDNTLMSVDREGIYVIDVGVEEENVFLKENVQQTLTPEDLERLAGAEQNCDPLLENHGTHILGLINGKVPSVLEGIARGIQVKTFDYNKIGQAKTIESDSLGDFTIAYGKLPQNVYRVINLSVDFEENQKTEKLKEDMRNNFRSFVQQNKRRLFVVAAGNGRKMLTAENVTAPVTEWHNDNVLVVTALDGSGKKLWKDAAYNQTSDVEVVHIAAPGEQIPSICNHNSIGRLSGTSQATAIVSSAAALLMNANVSDPANVKLRLMYTADLIMDIDETVLSGRLNLKRALVDINRNRLCVKNYLSDDGRECERTTQKAGVSTKEAAWGKGRILWEIKKPSDNTYEPVDKLSFRLANNHVVEDISREDICRIFFDRVRNAFTVILCKRPSKPGRVVREYVKYAGVKEIFHETKDDLFFSISQYAHKPVAVVGDYISALPSPE